MGLRESECGKMRERGRGRQGRGMEGERNGG